MKYDIPIYPDTTSVAMYKCIILINHNVLLYDIHHSTWYDLRKYELSQKQNISIYEYIIWNFLTSVDVNFCCWRLNRKWIKNDNSIASNRIWISEAHFGIPINMNEKPTLILINSCHNTMSDKSIEMNLQSTILFTVHDFRQKSTAVFLHFKLLLYSPLFTLQSIILLYSPQFYFPVHNFTLQSTILIYSPYIVNMWLETASFWYQILLPR